MINLEKIEFHFKSFDTSTTSQQTWNKKQKSILVLHLKLWVDKFKFLLFRDSSTKHFTDLQVYKWESIEK